MFNCSIRGKPEVLITWWTNGVQLRSNPELGITINNLAPEQYLTQSQLVLQSSGVSSAGTYICVGTSDIGTVAVNATLAVQGNDILHF